MSIIKKIIEIYEIIDIIILDKIREDMINIWKKQLEN